MPAYLAVGPGPFAPWPSLSCRISRGFLGKRMMAAVGDVMGLGRQWSDLPSDLELEKSAELRPSQLTNQGTAGTPNVKRPRAS